jgi:hypothetical protein
MQPAHGLLGDGLKKVLPWPVLQLGQSPQYVRNVSRRQLVRIDNCMRMSTSLMSVTTSCSPVCVLTSDGLDRLWLMLLLPVSGNAQVFQSPTPLQSFGTRSC